MLVLFATKVHGFEITFFVVSGIFMTKKSGKFEQILEISVKLALFLHFNELGMFCDFICDGICSYSTNSVL